MGTALLSVVALVVTLGSTGCRQTADTGPMPYSSPVQSIAEGKSRYETLVGQTAEYGPCWNTAVDHLRRGCRELTDEVQGRLALEFTNCFLAKLGLKRFECSTQEPLSECAALRNLTDRGVLASYTQFFTHAQVICSFLQSEMWQSRAERTITTLGETSLRVSEDMQRTARTQENLVRLQRDSSEVQQQILHNGRLLGDELVNWGTMLRRQHDLLAVALERAANLQAFFVGQLAVVQTVTHYAVAVVLSLLLTVPKRCAAARPWLLVLFTCSLFTEKMLVDWAAREEVDQPVLFAKEVSRLLNVSGCLTW